MEYTDITIYILTYLENRLQENPTLDELEEALHYSKFYLNRIFREKTGQTIGMYLRARRLTEAARKLVETDAPIIDIALESGYHSQQAFTGAFQQFYQCPPKVYRERKQFTPICPSFIEKTSIKLYRLEGWAA